MSVQYNPSIVTSGLIVCLDAGNTKSFDARENFLLYSEQLNNASGWNQQTATVTPNLYNSPIGTTTADSISSASDVGIYQIVSVSTATVYTASVYLLLTSATTSTSILFRDQGGTGHHLAINTSTKALSQQTNLISSGITDVGGGWYRVWMTYTTNSTSCLFTIRPDSQVGTTTIVAWGAQLEKGSYVSAYTATTSTSVTRSTVWSDLSGTGNHATMYNGLAYTTNNGGTLNFDEVDDYAKINNAGILPTAAYTKLAWFRPETNTQNIISGGTNDHAFWMAGFGDSLRAGHNGNWATVSYSPGSMLNQWWHGAVTFNTTTGWVLYLNGVQVATNSSLTPFASASDVRIGAYGDAANLFDGDIPIVHIYNRALTAAEIAQNFNAQRGRYGI